MRPQQPQMSLLERIFHPNWFMPTAIVIVRAFARLFYGLKVTGLNNVPSTGGGVVACNHVSTWDPPIVGVAINRKLEFMAKKELFEKPLLSALLRGLRAFPVDRDGQDIGAIKEALRRLGQGRMVGIFVQGTRNAGDAAALDGASYLAQRASVPVIPTAIWRQGRAFHVAFGEPIVPTGKSRDEARELTQTVMAKIGALLPAAKAEEA